MDSLKIKQDVIISMKLLLGLFFVVAVIAFCIHDFTLMDAFIDFTMGGFLGFGVAYFVSHDKR